MAKKNLFHEARRIPWTQLSSAHEYRRTAYALNILHLVNWPMSLYFYQLLPILRVDKTRKR